MSDFGHSPHYSYSFYLREKKKIIPGGVRGEGELFFFFCAHKIGGGVGGVGGSAPNSLPAKRIFFPHSKTHLCGSGG